MTMQRVVLEDVIDLTRRLTPADQLRLISVLSERLRHNVEMEQELRDEHDENDEEAQLLERLEAAGMLVEPTSEMRARAAAWEALPASEKQKTIRELQHLELTPSLSEIITQSREFRPGWEWIIEE